MLTPPFDDLFFDSLVRSYVEANRRFLRRHWLATELHASLNESGRSFVLLSAEPGAGKSALMAQLAHDHPEWLRYFIRRDQRTVLADVSDKSLLLRIGYQLATRRPELFSVDAMRLSVVQTIGEVAQQGELVGAEVKRLTASPFYQKVLEIEQRVGRTAGKAVALQVEELVVDARLLSTQDLVDLALILPARALARTEPGRLLVILIDALDEIRYHPEPENILAWLTNCPALPENVRFVVTSRPPDEALKLFCDKQATRLARLEIARNDENVRHDIETFVTRLSGEPAIGRALQEAGVDAPVFIRTTAGKAHGNLGYLDALARGLDGAIARNEPTMLRELVVLGELPADLQGLYAFFLRQIKTSVARERIEQRDPETGDTYDKPVWPTVYYPILGVLAVATQPVDLDQIIWLGGIRAERFWVSDALDRLLQFLDVQDGRYRSYHATLAEFLTSDTTRASSDGGDLYVNPIRWNTQVADVLWRARHNWSTLDTYGLNSLALHLFRGQDIARLVALIEKNWMFARVAPNNGRYTDYVADVDLALDAIVNQSRPMVAALCRLHVARHLAFARTDAYRIEDLLILVWLGEVDEALAFARMQSEPSAVFGVLMEAIGMPETTRERKATLLDAAVAAVAGIRAERDRLKALTTLGTAVARSGDGVRARRVFDEAWELAGRLPREQSLPDLAAALAQAGDERGTQAFVDARTLIDDMDFDSDSSRWQRPDARLDLVRALTRAGRFSQATSVAESMREDASMLVEAAFRSIAEDLARSGRFDEARAVALEIRADDVRIVALCAVATAMFRAGGTRAGVTQAAELIEEAYRGLDRIRQRVFITSLVSCLGALGTALTLLGDQRAAGVFAEATTTLAGRRDFLSLHAVRVLAESLAQAGRVNEALQLARDDVDARRGIAATLARSGDARARSVFADVRTQVELRSGSVQRSPIAFAEALVSRGRADAALQLSSFASWEYGRAQVIEIGAEGLVSEGRYDEARRVIAAIGDAGLQSQAMAVLAAQVSHGQVGPDLQAAISIAAGDPERVRKLALALARAAEGRLAVGVVETVPEDRNRSFLWNEVVRELVDGGSLDQAAEIAASQVPVRGDTLAHLVAGLCVAGRVEDARHIAERIADPSQGTVAWRSIAVAEPSSAVGGASDAFTRALADADRVMDGLQRIEALAMLGEALTRSGDVRAKQAFDDALEATHGLQGRKHEHAAMRLAVAMERSGDPRAHTLFDEALAPSPVPIRRNPQDPLSDFDVKMARARVIDALIEAGCYDKAHEALSELAERDRIRHLIELGRALGAKRDERAVGLLREARSLCAFDGDEPGRLMRLQEIANAMAESDLLHEALITARPHHLDRYLDHLARWAPLFERQMPGLSGEVLCVATEVAAWLNQDWARIHAIVCPASPPGPERA